MTVIGLKGIQVFGHHGVFSHERQNGQTFVVDVRCGVVHPPDDDVALTVDYGALAQRVHDLVAHDPVDLIETVADRVAAGCLAFDGVEWAEATIHKPQAPMPVPVDDVSVTVTRTRTDG